MDTPLAPLETRPRSATTATYTASSFDPQLNRSQCLEDAASRNFVPLDTVSKNAPPHVAVRYGDTIRLFARSKYTEEGGDGGYVGTIECSKRFFASKNVEKKDELVCIPPISSCGATQFKPSTFVILSFSGLKVGTPVSYGDVVVLVDADGRVWNNKIGLGPSTKNGCFGPKESNRPGEMYLSFYQLQTDVEKNDSSSDSQDEEDNFVFLNKLAKTKKNMTETTVGKPTQGALQLATAALRTMGKVIYYGDQNVIIDVADSNRLRSKFNRVITHLCKQQESAPVQGGFLRCDGRGKTILFELHGQEFSTIKSIDINDMKESDAGSSGADIDKKSIDDAGHHVLVSTRSDVAVGSPLLLQDLRRSMSVVVRFSDGGQVQVPCQRFLKHEGSAFYRLVLGGNRSMRILVRATRVVSRKTVDLRGTLRGTYRQIFKLSCGIVIAYLAGASVFTHVFGLMLVLPAVYTGVFAGVVVFVVEVFFPGTVVTARQISSLDAEEHHLRDCLGNWNFAVLALEASESERLENAVCVTKSAQLVVSVPPAFLVAENGNAAKALERYETTLAWRKEVRADYILSVPQTHYKAIKA